MGWEYKPGSREAIVRGCVCPVSDNREGMGAKGGGYITDGDCPLHGVYVVDDGPNYMLAFVLIAAAFTLATGVAFLVVL